MYSYERSPESGELNRATKLEPAKVGTLRCPLTTGNMEETFHITGRNRNGCEGSNPLSEKGKEPSLERLHEYRISKQRFSATAQPTIE